MSDFQLNISLEPEQVQKLKRAGQRITIVKACSSGSSEAYNMAWVNFSVMQMCRVSWSTSFAVYASDIQVQNGAKIESVAQMNATARFNEYCFSDDNIFEVKEKSGGNDNVYYAKNENSDIDSYTFGLAQTVTVNSECFQFNPINAVRVFKQQNAAFTPIEKIKIYMEGSEGNGRVLSTVASDALLVDFTKKTQQKIKFDDNTSKFVLI